jgi:hypothetical protein
MPVPKKQLIEELDGLSSELEALTAAQSDGLDFFRTRVNQLINDVVGARDALAIKFNGLQWTAGGGSVRRRLDSFGQPPGFVTADDTYNFDRAKQSTREVLQSLKWKLERDGASADREPSGRSAHESAIIAALEAQAPNAGPCYQQAIRDLADPDRLSYRGTADELRATVWEVLEALAPDDIVSAKLGFVLEKGQTKPTQKQKARHILSQRLGETARQTAETSLDILEEKVGSLVRAVYGRSSTSSHIETEKSEVEQIKRYVDTVLTDLLDVSASR